MNVKLFMKRHASTGLTLIGVAGVIATAVLAAKAAPKATELVKKAELEKGEELTKWETVKTAAPVYIPSIVMGASTIGCILGANVLNKRKQAGLASAYALLDNSFKEYKKKMTELYGEDADRRIRSEIVRDNIKLADISLSEGSQLFYDFYSGRYFESTSAEVLNAEYTINRSLSMKGYAYLNDWYEELGLDPIDSGFELGWSKEACFMCYRQAWVDFHHELVAMDDKENEFGNEGLECIVIYMHQEPLINCDFIGH